MTAGRPSQAQAVIIGGGVIGCAVAYHLARLGWREIVLLERKQLTSGTTWHAAGLIGQLRATPNLTRLALYSAELYDRLEAETGQPTGFKRNGSLNVARTHDRFIELQRQAAMGRASGLEIHVLGQSEAKGLHPLIEVGDLAGAIHVVGDGQANPIDITQALAKGARRAGATIVEGCKVTGITQANGRVTGVVTEQGPIRSDVVVNCAGMWGREVGDMAGVPVPLHACEHFYVLTEPMAGVRPDLPVLRDADACIYVKEDAGKLLVGAFEPVAKPWGMDGIPDEFEFGELPEDWDHFMPILEDAMVRIPTLADAGIRKFFCGPESFTPDDRYHLGEAPELHGFFVACGLNSIGIQSAGGLGLALAQWIVEGHPPMDLADVDLRRMQPFQNNRRYLHDRAVEGLGLLYAMHWPFRQFESARPARTSPLHDRLAARGACFAEAAGWERPGWFGERGSQPQYDYSYGRPTWFANRAAEHEAVRTRAGLFDLSSFAKFRLQGRDAEAVLQRVCTNDVAVPPGCIVYTQWLNANGGIEADLTVTRLAEDDYLIVTGVMSQRRDFHWLSRQIGDARAVLTDVTSGLAVLALMGPDSRDLLAPLTPADLSNQAFPFATAQEIELGYALVRAHRISYVGELGWELYIPSEFALSVFDVLMASLGDRVTLAGYQALDSLRLEKAFRHFGHDIGDEDTPIEAGLGFTCALDKGVDFIGRDVVLRQRERVPTKRLVQFRLTDPGPQLFHDEPIVMDGQYAGLLTSGSFGHTLGAALGMGYVSHQEGVDSNLLNATRFEIEVAGKRVPAEASLRPFYDPRHQRMRG